MNSLDALLAPCGVAIVGASQGPTKLGYGAARNLVVSGYQGGIYSINPRGGTLFEREMYADIREVPDLIDLVVILIPAPAEDPNTNVITMDLEGVDQGREFVEAARQLMKHKPVVAIKVGKSENGRAVVASHTGAMAGTDQAYNAAFRRAGVLGAQTSEEMFDWARYYSEQTGCPLSGLMGTFRVAATGQSQTVSR